MSNTFAPKLYPYKPKKLIMLLAFVFFAVAAGFIGAEAQTNEVGLDLVLFKQVMESFNPVEATRFYWVLAFISALFSLVGLLGLYKAFTSQSVLILTEETITIPGGIFSIKKEKVVEFADIISLELSKVNSIRFLKIIHNNGQVSVSDSMLPNKNMLDEICEYLKLHV